MDHTPTLDLNAAKGVYRSMLTQSEPPDTQFHHQGKNLELQTRMRSNLLSLGAGQIVSRSKPFQGRGNDVEWEPDCTVPHPYHVPSNVPHVPPRSLHQIARTNDDFYQTSLEIPLKNNPVEAFDQGRLPHYLTRIKDGQHNLTLDQTDDQFVSRIDLFQTDDPPDHFEDSLLFYLTHMKTTGCLEDAKTSTLVFPHKKARMEKLSFFGDATSFSAPAEISLVNLDPPAILDDLRRPLEPEYPKKITPHSVFILESPTLKPNG